MPWALHGRVTNQSVLSDSIHAIEASEAPTACPRPQFTPSVKHPLQQDSLAMKKAVLVGVRYTRFDETYRIQVKGMAEQAPLGASASLPTPHKDCDTMANLLVDVYGFERKNIVMLKDDGTATDPTRENIISALKELVRDASEGDQLAFHFSGHGSQIASNNENEVDGFDEIVLPSDVKYNPNEQAWSVKELENYIVDDELNDILVKGLPSGVRLTVILDCCHSGTGMDLPYDSTTNLELLMSPVAEPGSGPFSFSTSETKGRRESVSSVHDGRPKKMASLNSKLPFVGTVENASGKEASGKEDTGLRGLEIRTLKKDHDGFDEERTQYITFWAACVDNEVTIEDTSGGGILTMALDNALREKKERTHRELLVEIRRSFEGVATKAKEYSTPN